MDKTKTYYICGPMTGIAQYNYPLFRHVADVMRNRGVKCINPAEEDSPETQAAATASKDGAHDADGTVGGVSYGALLARGVQTVTDRADGFILLPDWRKSKGARLEVATGLLTGKHLFYQFFPATPNGGDADEFYKEAIYPVPVAMIRGELMAAL